jgi:hypothetical protein
MTKINSKSSPISLGRIRGEAGGLNLTSSLSTRDISNFAFNSSFPRIGDDGQTLSGFSLGADFKFSEFEFMDANPGYYLIADGEDDYPTLLERSDDGWLETDDGDNLVSDNENGNTSVVAIHIINATTLINVNLRSILFQTRGYTTEAEAIIFINRGVVYSKDSSLPALQTGSGWENNSYIKIINEGLIYGAGGDGGNALNYNTDINGKDGGDAISLQYNVEIENNGGSIFGGGGGGSGSLYSGGGGGAGIFAGKGGFGNANGNDGTAINGGAPGTLFSDDTFAPMPGGDLAKAGFGNAGSGGAAGHLLRKNGFSINSNTLNNGNFTSTTLKGTIG